MANNRLNNIGSWIGPGLTSFNESTLFTPGALGSFYEKDGKKYQLVKFDSSAVTVAANQALVWIDQDDFTVTNDISDVTGGPNFPAGVALSVVTAGNYGWIQVRGPVAAILTDAGDDITAGDALFVDPTTDGTVDSTALGTAPIYVPLAVATASDVDSLDTVACILIAPLNGA